MTRTRFTCLFAVVSVLLVAATAPRGPQSDNETRRENQRLRTQVQDLERELEAAHTRIEKMERQIESLRRAVEAAGVSGAQATGSTPPLPVSIDESVPNASPRALVAAIVESYREATADLEMGRHGDRDRIVYMRLLEKWASRVNREFKSQVVWHVRVVTAPWHDDRNPRLELMAVDPETGTELGKPFSAQATRNVLRRIAALERRGELNVLRLKGIVLPNIRINPARETAGAFDRPRFIGPFAEGDMTIAASSVSLPEKDESEESRRRP